ncbi:uncharacterized protein KQ657_003672 [Scheffersomyces spartinae]|uniref:Telomere-associated protein Rif1 N-terminal domain-containing protein n=1 Tax=Scheffersomyces spartinae TaxID=45513 RepID=A0A9P8AJU3_9ASCO|nr:uncharacterized protein KQ657_003672 [Scheffersomyces spartinae]KAG7195151.1 hypothetical protein KQ657_003672 [Scheffersomyces spartinae]
MVIILTNNNNNDDDDNSHHHHHVSPGNPAYWQQGTIVQMSVDDLTKSYSKLIQGSIQVLSIDSFKLRFEVYASLNQLISIAEKPTIPLFAERMAAILSVVKRDITKLEVHLGICLSNDDIAAVDTFDAMDVRKLYQCLKFTTSMINILFRLGSNYFDSIMWYYKHATEILQNENLSRGILGPYISIIKEVVPLQKSQRDFFNANNLPAIALDAVLNMRQLNSSAIISDRFLAIRSLVTHFPATMASRVQRWLPSLLVNMLRMPPVIQSKCQTIAIQTLFEAARSFIDDTATLSKIQILMDSPIPFDICFFFQGDDIQKLYEGKSLVEFVIEELRLLAQVEESKNALDIWTAISILIGGPHFHKWSPLNLWIQFLFDVLLTSKNESIQRKSIHAWRAIVHNTCYYSLANSSYLLKQNNSTTEIVSLLLRLFNHLDDKTVWNSNPILFNEISSLTLSIVYSLLNQKHTQKWHTFYWTEIINPLFKQSIFKFKFEDEIASNLFKRLLASEAVAVQEDFNPLRCLSHDCVEVKEIIPLTQKWVHSNIPILAIYLEGILLSVQPIPILMKFECLKLLISKVKSIIKRELKGSEGTNNLLHHLPKWNTLIMESEGFTVQPYIEYMSMVFDIFDNNDLKNTFILQTLESLSKIGALSIEDLQRVMNKICEFVDDNDSISSIVEQLLSRSIYNTNLPFVLRQVCKSKEIYLKLSGKILTYCDKDYEPIVEDILSMSPTRFECAKDFLEVWLPVNMHLWKLQALGYLAVKAHATTQVNVRALVVRFLKIKIESHIDTMNILRFMIDNDLYDFLYQTGAVMFESSKSLEVPEIVAFTKLWRKYLLQKSRTNDFKSLDKLLLVTFTSSEIDTLTYVKGRWDQLPKLKKRWLKKYGELPVWNEDGDNNIINGDDDDDEDLKLSESDSGSNGSLFSSNDNGSLRELSSSSQLSRRNPGEELSEEVSMSDNKDSWSDHEPLKHQLELKGSNLLSPRVEVPMTQEDNSSNHSITAKVIEASNQPQVIVESSIESSLEENAKGQDSIAYNVLSKKSSGEGVEPVKTRQLMRLISEIKNLVGDEQFLEEANHLSSANGIALNGTLSELIDVALHVKANLLK